MLFKDFFSIFSSGTFPALDLEHSSSPLIMHFHARFQAHLARHTFTTGITSEINQ